MTADDLPRIAYAFAKAHGVLAVGQEGEAVVVLVRPDATVDGIAELRRALKDDAETPRFIETLIGQGYRFVAAVEVGR